MSKLEKIKSLWRNEYELEGYDITEYIELPEGYIDWLIEQAEEVERLNRRYIGEYAQLEAENKRLRQLLHNWGLNADAVPKEMPESLMSAKKEPY